MAKIKENGIVKAAVSQEYVDDSSSESDFELSANKKKSSTKPQSESTSTTGSEAESEAVSRSDSSNVSENESASASSAAGSSPAKKRSSEVSQSVSEPWRKRPKLSKFPPPSGFDPIKVDASYLNSDIGEMFSNLNEKQVWHITAPASVSLTSIQSLDISAAERGEAILHHDGASYSLVALPSKSESLLLPGGSENVYTKANVNISRSFHIREILQDNESNDEAGSKAPDHKSDSSDLHLNTFFASKEGTKKAAREQPSGLLMRYQPYGSMEMVEKPYQLPLPDASDDREKSSQPIVPFVDPATIENGELHSSQRSSRKGKDGKKSKSGKDIYKNGVGSETPRLKTKASSIAPDSERKRKKERRERMET